MMPVLTLHEPWATAMALGVKQIETRSWFTRYSGPLAIHAGKTFDLNFYETIGQVDGLPSREQIEAALGHILCVVNLQEVVSAQKIRAHPGWYCGDESLWPREQRWGDFSHGRFGWVTDGAPRGLIQPVPWVGRQGLKWLPKESEELVRQYAGSAGEGAMSAQTWYRFGHCLGEDKAVEHVVSWRSSMMIPHTGVCVICGGTFELRKRLRRVGWFPKDHKGPSVATASTSSTSNGPAPAQTSMQL